MPTACILIVGDEILGAKIRDENSPWLAAQLRALGIALRRIVVVPDLVEAIAEEVSGAVDRADVVITTGGVGPTHDDLTMEGVARGLGVPLVTDSGLEALVKKWIPDAGPDALRMAQVPVGADVVWGSEDHFPLVRVGSLFVLPGVPKLMRQKFDMAKGLMPRGQVVETTMLISHENETTIAARLREVAEAHPEVQLGSYPQKRAEGWIVKITVDSIDAAARASAVRALQEAGIAKP